MIILVIGVISFLQIRNNLYRQSGKIIDNYINNDYSCHLPQGDCKTCDGGPKGMNAVLLHYAGYIRYFSKVNGQVNAEVEDYVKQRLIDCQFKFRLDEPPDKS